MTPSAIIFDLDGTLYNAKRLPLRLIMGDLRHALTLRAERKVRRAMKGRFYDTPEALYAELFAGIARERGITPTAAADWYQRRYMPLMVAVLTMYYDARPCAPQLLATLRERGVKTVVFSDYGEVEAKLSALGLEASMFDAVFDAPSLGGFKPCREAYERLLSRCGLEASQCLMVGDRDDTDGAGAASVGMPFRKVKTRREWDALLDDALHDRL